MKRLFQKRDQEQLEDMEHLLKDVFEPVAPRHDYIHEINRRLSKYPAPASPIVYPTRPQVSGKPLASLIWQVLGLLSGITLVIVGIRVVILLVSSLRAIYQKQI